MSTTSQTLGSDHGTALHHPHDGHHCGLGGGLAIEESELRASDNEPVAVAFLAMPCIREHQACLLEGRLRGMASRCGGRLIVSMSEVGDITSAGINALVVVHAHCRDLNGGGGGSGAGGGVGGHMAICGLSRELHELFKLTHLDRTIILASDVSEAMRTFGPHARRPWLLRALSGRHKAA